MRVRERPVLLGSRRRARTIARSKESSCASASVHQASNSEEVAMTAAMISMYIVLPFLPVGRPWISLATYPVIPH